ncbi:MFS transporter [Cognatishimia sp. SS12]|uniref:MFS transporter n=1 Tax=Cognatishimia sp. SS12 TaxID=2979465 RepID=UPI00232CBDDD|nr:MFS transporter [Cognatishimia sp. SS12]MDC0737495.1 MFS transporter [Cognatishimia sp. SS12]
MGQFVSGSWALLLGIMLLMVGNGVQGTLLGIRGEIEGFSTFEMSIVMSAYFVGFLGGSKLTPEMIRRVGHVRVFAALASVISAVLVLYPVAANPWVWIFARVLIGFSFSGVYVTAESWLNNAATNETRGTALSIYMLVQMIGIIAAQGILMLSDPSGFAIFVIPSILVSLAVTPILLSVSPTPAFESSKSMPLRKLWRTSPLGVFGVFLLGGVFAAQFGMSAVFGTATGLSVSQISIFVASFYVGATISQFPLGWLSDRMDRRLLITMVAAVGVAGGLLGMVPIDSFWLLVTSALFLGGTANPLYSILIAHTNDFVEIDDLPGVSGGLIFVNGLGAIAGPVVIGALMSRFGPNSFFGFMAAVLGTLTLYAVYRATRRAAPAVDDTISLTPVTQSATPVVWDAAQEMAQIEAEEAAEASDLAAEEAMLKN